MKILIIICIIYVLFLTISVDTKQYNPFFAWLLDFLAITLPFCLLAFCLFLWFKADLTESQMKHEIEMKRIEVMNQKFAEITKLTQLLKNNNQ